LGMLGGYYLGIKTVRTRARKSYGRLNINLDGLPLGLALMAAKNDDVKIPMITMDF
jgi:hypothetical protein